MSFFSTMVSPNQKALHNVAVGTHFTLRKGHNNATMLAKKVRLDWVSYDYKHNRTIVSNQHADGSYHGYGYKNVLMPASGVYVRTSEPRVYVKECQKYHLQVVHLGTGESYWISEFSWAHVVNYSEVESENPAHYAGIQ